MAALAGPADIMGGGLLALGLLGEIPIFAGNHGTVRRRLGDQDVGPAEVLWTSGNWRHSRHRDDRRG
jgi:hypothetical protein